MWYMMNTVGHLRKMKIAEIRELKSQEFNSASLKMDIAENLNHRNPHIQEI